jgi:hypothetical protein
MPALQILVLLLHSTIALCLVLDDTRDELTSIYQRTATKVLLTGLPALGMRMRWV